MKTNSIVPVERVENCIYVIRGHKVIFDSDLASLYGVETRALVQAVKRNLERFPDDFMFHLIQEEFNILRSQNATLNPNSLISQIVTSKGRGGLRKLPHAFTEEGVAMLSSVLRSPRAATVNIEIMRAFVRMRRLLESNKELAKAVIELRSFMLIHLRLKIYINCMMLRSFCDTVNKQSYGA